MWATLHLVDLREQFFVGLNVYLMKTKQQKQSELHKLKEQLPKQETTVFTSFARQGEPGLTVAQMQQLRRALREVGGSYLTIKKNLVDIAVRDLHYDGLDVFGMTGSIGLVMGEKDGQALMKKVYDFAKKNPALQLFSAINEGAVLSREQVIELASLPSRDVLIARVLGMAKYPIAALAMVLSQIADKSANQSN